MNNSYKKTVLDNGLTIIFYQIKEVKSAYITCIVKCGNDYISNSSEIGIPHFLEHLSFVATEKFKTRKSISNAIDNIGAYANANTNILGTRYWVKVPFINTEKAIDILYQMIFKSILKKEEIEKEKGIVISEYENSQISEASIFNSKKQENRFNILPYRFPATGKPDQIRSFTKERLLKFKDDFYNPNNMVISVVGNFDEGEILQKIRNTFGTEKKGKKFEFTKYKNDKYSDSLTYVQNNASNQVWFNIVWPVFGWCEVSRNKEMVLKIMNNILGKGPSSILNLSLREEKGITYSCGSGITMFPYLGTIDIYGSVDKEKLSSAFVEINRIIHDLKTKNIGSSELAKTKKFIELGDYLHFESPESISNYLTGELFDYNEIWPSEKYTKECNKVTNSEIRKLANEIFTPEKINVSFLGNISQEEGGKLRKILD